MFERKEYSRLTVLEEKSKLGARGKERREGVGVGSGVEIMGSRVGGGVGSG